MADGVVDVLSDKRALARRRAYEAPLETLNPAWASAFRDDAHWPYFERLRAEDPVHWTPDTNHEAFSSARGIGLPPKPSVLPADAFIQREVREGGETADDTNSFINMD